MMANLAATVKTGCNIARVRTLSQTQSHGWPIQAIFWLEWATRLTQESVLATNQRVSP
jgi:hypothetical protein